MNSTHAPMWNKNFALLISQHSSFLFTASNKCKIRLQYLYFNSTIVPVLIEDPQFIPYHRGIVQRGASILLLLIPPLLFINLPPPPPSIQLPSHLYPSLFLISYTSNFHRQNYNFHIISYHIISYLSYISYLSILHSTHTDSITLHIFPPPPPPPFLPLSFSFPHTFKSHHPNPGGPLTLLTLPLVAVALIMAGSPNGCCCWY
jgi:hypothetical protein